MNIQQLIEAVKTIDLERVNRLLEVEAITHALPLQSTPVLSQAAYHGHLKIVNRLLEIETVRNKMAAHGNQALFLAAVRGKRAVVNRLLEFEAVRSRVAARDNYVLREAARAGHLDVVNALLKFEDVRNNVAAMNNSTLCHVAGFSCPPVENHLVEMAIDDVTAQMRLLGFKSGRNDVADPTAMTVRRLLEIPQVTEHDSFKELYKRYAIIREQRKAILSQQASAHVIINAWARGESNFSWLPYELLSNMFSFIPSCPQKILDGMVVTAFARNKHEIQSEKAGSVLVKRNASRLPYNDEEKNPKLSKIAFYHPYDIPITKGGGVLVKRKASELSDNEEEKKPKRQRNF